MNVLKIWYQTGFLPFGTHQCYPPCDFDAQGWANHLDQFSNFHDLHLRYYEGVEALI